MSNNSGPLPVGAGDMMDADLPAEKMERNLQKENKRLRGDIKQMEMKIKAMQIECTKSFQMKDRLEGLCRELQKQNKFIKNTSEAKIQEANARGKELASEVQNNMGFMKSINENLAAISSESLTVKRENDELAKKIAILKGHYEEREQILQEALKETNESMHKAKIELGETKLKGAEEKEKLIGEMQKLADALLQSREQVKDSKQTELTLRGMIQNYEDKFNGLQKLLKDTNGSYEEFRSEMTKVSTRTKELEKETIKWQKRWEESNIALQKMRENYARVQDDLVKSQENLEKMKTLCRSLHTENRDLLAELKVQQPEQQKNDGSDGGESGGSSNATSSSATEGITGLTPLAEATLASINADKANEVVIQEEAVSSKEKEKSSQNQSESQDAKTPEKVVVDTNQNKSSPAKKTPEAEPAAAAAVVVVVKKEEEKEIKEKVAAPSEPSAPLSSPVTDTNATVASPPPTSPARNDATPTPTTPTAPLSPSPKTPPSEVGGTTGKLSASTSSPTPGDTSDSGSKGKKNKNKKKNKK